MLRDFSRKSPMDLEGKWFDDRLVWSAEVFYRELFGASASIRPPPAAQRVVRANWRGISGEYLTDAERELAYPAIAKLAETLKATLAAIVKRMPRKRSDLYVPRAREIVTMPLLAEDDPRVRELAEAMTK